MKYKKYSAISLLFLIISSLIFAQNTDNKIIKARLMDDSGNAVSFATIYAINAKQGTISKENGWFTISAMYDDILEFSALSYEKLRLKVSDISSSDSTIIILKRKAYMLGDVNVMEMRWHDFKYQIMNSEAPKKQEKAIQLQGLPNVNQPRVELGQYAGMTNPMSILLVYFSRQNINKRRQDRWRKIYTKSQNKRDTVNKNPLALQKQ